MTRYAHIVIISILCSLIFLSRLIAQQVTPKFEHLTTKDGLPDHDVYAIYQDKEGYLWFGTQRGLVKYDGYSMKVYQSDSEDINSLSNNNITAIFEDKNGVLWVGTGYSEKGGLNKFDRNTERFKKYLFDSNDSTTINSNFITCIYEDKSSNLWIGTIKGINLLNKKTNTFKRYNFTDVKYDDAVYKYIEKLRGAGKTIQSILKVGDNANISKKFTLHRPTPVLVTLMSEGINDIGWLEDVQGKIILKTNPDESLYAGGKVQNRIQIWCDTLNQGKYRLNYLSNHRHSYDSWHHNDPIKSWEESWETISPDYPDYWGIQVFSLIDEQVDINDFLSSHTLVDQIGGVYDIVENEIKGDLILGTDIPGVYMFNIADEVFYRPKYLSNDFKNTNLGIVYDFQLAKDKTIWIASSQGLTQLNNSTGECNLYQEVQSNVNIIENEYYMVAEDFTGSIWIAGSGILEFNIKDKSFRRFVYDDDDPYSLLNNNVTLLFEDRYQNMWVGSRVRGLNKWDRNRWKFKHHYKQPKKENTLMDNTISAIFADTSGMLWFATNGYLSKLNRNTNQYKHYWFGTPDYKDYIIFQIFQDDYGSLWLPTEGFGLGKFDPEDEKFEFFIHNPKDENSISNDDVQWMIKDHKGIFWIATYGGLNCFNPVSKKFTRIVSDSNDSCAFNCEKILTVFEDKNYNIWIGTQKEGFYKYSRVSNCFEKILSYDDLNILNLLEDTSGNMWIGTEDNGLIRLNTEDGSQIKITTREGLVTDQVRSILEDDKGNLWVATVGALTKINPVSLTIKNYTFENGMPLKDFMFCSAFKDKNGVMFFGGDLEGFISFHPDSIRDNMVPPQVVISNVSLMEHLKDSVNINPSIPKLNLAGLDYDQNNLRFDFVALHYSNPPGNRYKYKLENATQSWIDAGTQRYAIFTNLDPGEYIFRVVASNSDGIWNEEGASLKFVILPPWWATTWAYIIYALLIIGTIYFTWKLQLQRVRNKHEYELSKFEAEKMHEVDEMKSRFFANISHEFRTPLTLILGPAKDVIDETDEPKIKKNAGIIKRNASRLLGLVNQLLDLSKIEAGRMKLAASEQNIIPLLKGLVLSFSSLAERKKIQLQFITIEKELNVFVDKDKIEKIVNNLLFNAFKFTPEGGKIDFTIEKHMNDVGITIADNGVGIPEGRIDKIFDRFYQVDTSQTREGEGTGIGLALTKELVELHKGKITAKSIEGKGTTFIVQIPLGKDHLRPEEIVQKQAEEIIPKNEVQIEQTIETERRKDKTDIVELLETDKPMLLIVEDNSDVRSYIISHLEEDYRIQEAIDGEDGLNKAIENIPDLIISDVMMPKMDGFQMCNELKTDERTSHIPIIMLTAKATSQDKMEGYETGADDYIMKPFDAKELKVRIKNLIEIRRKLQEKFSSDDYTIPKELGSIDEQFLKKVLQVINEHIAEEDFSIEALANAAAVSRKHLHRKLRALTGKTPSQFFRSIRLTKAKTLIKEKKGTISEISFSVGFSSPIYFDKCFKEEFGSSPSDMY